MSRGQGGSDSQNAGGLSLLHVSAFWMWSFPRMKGWLAGKGQLLWSSTSALNTMSDAQKNLNKCLQNGSFSERTNTSLYPVSSAISCTVYQNTEKNNHWLYNCIQVSHSGWVCLPLAFTNHVVPPTFTLCHVLLSQKGWLGPIRHESVWVNFQFSLQISTTFHSHKEFCVVII